MMRRIDAWLASSSPLRDRFRRICFYVAVVFGALALIGHFVPSPPDTRNPEQRARDRQQFEQDWMANEIERARMNREEDRRRLPNYPGR